MTAPEQTIDSALREYFLSFADGGDVPPARRFFLEGYLQAVIDMEQMTADQVRQTIFNCCRDCLGAEAAERYRDASVPFVLHSHMRRAPVYPTN